MKVAAVILVAALVFASCAPANTGCGKVPRQGEATQSQEAASAAPAAENSSDDKSGDDCGARSSKDDWYSDFLTRLKQARSRRAKTLEST